jgi:nicotinamidase/pyrazinamidase
VKFSTLDALELGFKPHVIEDACRGINLHPGDVQRALSDMRKAGAEIITSDRILAPS